MGSARRRADRCSHGAAVDHGEWNAVRRRAHECMDERVVAAGARAPEIAERESEASADQADTMAARALSSSTRKKRFAVDRKRDEKKSDKSLAQRSLRKPSRVAMDCVGG